MSLSVAFIDVSENSSPKFPLMGTARLSIAAALALTFCHIFCKESMSLSKLACMLSPGCLLTYDNFTLRQFLIAQFHNLFEIVDEWIYLMDDALHSF